MSKHILLVSATQLEIQPTLDRMGITPLLPPGESEIKVGEHTVRILITGVGVMQASFHLAEAIHRKKPDVVLNAGIAGALDHSLKLGEAVWVTSERLGDLGALGPDGFEDIADMGFADKDQFPYKNGWLALNTATDIMGWYDDQLKMCSGVTVNTISGTEDAVNRLKSMYRMHVETMEGAGVFYACLYWGIPVYQLRTISNFVEVLDRSRWDIPLAIQTLNDQLNRLFLSL
jgi:futalosine hydrolase